MLVKSGSLDYQRFPDFFLSFYGFAGLLSAHTYLRAYRLNGFSINKQKDLENPVYVLMFPVHGLLFPLQAALLFECPRQYYKIRIVNHSFYYSSKYLYFPASAVIVFTKYNSIAPQPS